MSYGGLTKIAGVAEEVKRPRRNLPRGMFAAFLVVSLMYVLAVFVTVGLVGLTGLSGSLTPISLGAGAVMGRWGAALLAAAALGAFVTTGNAGILSASRFPMAMSRDQIDTVYRAWQSIGDCILLRLRRAAGYWSRVDRGSGRTRDMIVDGLGAG